MNKVLTTFQAPGLRAAKAFKEMSLNGHNFQFQLPHIRRFTFDLIDSEFGASMICDDKPCFYHLFQEI